MTTASSYGWHLPSLECRQTIGAATSPLEVDSLTRDVPSIDLWSSLVCDSLRVLKPEPLLTPINFILVLVGSAPER